MHENGLTQRKKRIADAIALKEPDRVPFAPKMGTAFCKAGGIDIYEAMIDIKAAGEGVRAFFSRYEADLYRPMSLYPIPVMETLGTTNIHWPGPLSKLGMNAGHQIEDVAFLLEEEYDEFLMDPSHFFLTKLYPRRHSKLSGLSKLAFNNVFEYGHYASLAAFSDAEVHEALIALLAAGPQAKKWADGRAYLGEMALEAGTPCDNLAAQAAPYDMFADNIRGYLNVPMDLFSVPEKVERAIELMEFYAIQAIESFAGRGVNACWIPLHGGFDEFMSVEMYRKYYWPSLLRMIERLVSKGITPYVFCEGRYDSRLETLREVPKGKVVFMFEKVEIAVAKKTLGDVACICGNLPGAMLVQGSKEAVVEETKRLLDICAPGGGFIMDSSMSIDNNYDEGLLDAWYETTLTCGVY